MKINHFIDHTLLKPEATPEQVLRLCEEAHQYNFAAVCINPVYVPLAVDKLQSTLIKVCTVVGFPLGNNISRIKAAETDNAVANGAREIDMVLQVGQLKNHNYQYVEQDIRMVVEASAPLAIVKVILETCLLEEAEIMTACKITQQAGAHFVKTSTGFNKAGATIEQVALMRKTVGNEMGVKAAGGIRDYETALKMIQAGANRLGTSASVAIVETSK
ncbi:deoxyribose-phosphate aldolase [candidate division KSB1 bacterium]|nr:deoxyribose-phosphate aldolase [candidate division KSB1 bacterium]